MSVVTLEYNLAEYESVVQKSPVVFDKE